jgi:hypothetical protein
VIYNFKTTEDGQQWVIDTEALTWARASSILATPSVKAATSNLARFVASEEGKLIPMGGGRYALEGRRPLDKDRKPQLALVIILNILTSEGDGSCVTFIQANVDVKDLQHTEIKNFHVECLPAIRPPNRPAPQAMPPITADEQKAQAPPQPMGEIQ